MSIVHEMSCVVLQHVSEAASEALPSILPIFNVVLQRLPAFISMTSHAPDKRQESNDAFGAQSDSLANVPCV